MADGREVEPRGSAEQAFDGLRATVASLAAEVAGQGARLAELITQLRQTPARAGKGGQANGIDQTLGAMMRDQRILAEKAEAVAKSPMLSWTPAMFAAAFVEASKDVRADDQRAMRSATDRTTSAADKVERALTSKRDADAQQIQNYRWGIGGLLAGLALYAAAVGPLARMTPDSWNLPEWMAMSTLGQSGENGYYQASRRLMAAHATETWNTMSVGGRIVRANERSLERCVRAAQRRGTARCTVTISRELGIDYLER